MDKMRNLQHIQLKEVESFDDDEHDFEMGDRPKKKFYHHGDTPLEKFKYYIKCAADSATATNTRKAMLLTAIFLVFLTLTLSVSLSSKSLKPKIPSIIYSEMKLPSWIKPVHYLAHITTFMSNNTFSGDMVITLNITDSQENYVVVHGDGFDLDSARLEVISSGLSNAYPVSYEAPKDSIVADKITFDKNNTYFIIQFDKLSEYLSKGDQYFNLYISYHTIISDSLAGYYISKYDEIGGVKKLAMTQFEPTDARLAFPCFDEPALKANWTIWMDVDSDYMALSNMELLSVNVNSGRRLVKFHTSPKMSTYLVCIITHQYTFINGTVELDNGRSILVRVWSSYLQANQTDYSLDAAMRSIKFYTEYFGIDYPLSKMDIIGVSDFAAGAMENWGLITFRNTDVFYSNQTASGDSKQRVSEVIAHEIAHQWFGDLVTMKWWNDLWLNEGFATFMSYKCLGSVFPEFDSKMDFLNLIKISGLSMDSTNNTHPISNNFVKVIDIQASFDSITYDKGASILGMLDSMMNASGADQFRTGIRNYLNKHQYSNAETADLWKELTAASNPTIQVDEIMHNWVTKAGLPYVNITSSNDGKSLSLAQHRYIATLDGHSDDDTVWSIPVSVLTDCSISQYNMDTAKKDLPIDLNTCKYALFNNRANSFVRYNYDSKTLDAISQQLAKDINSVDPLGVVEFLDDQFSFAQSGLIEPTRVMDMLSFLTKLTQVPTEILVVAMNGFGSISGDLYTQECYPQIRQFQQSLLKGILSSFDYQQTPSTYNETLYYKNVISLSSNARIQETLNFLNTTWTDLKLTPEKINPNYRRSMYMSIVTHGGLAEYNWVYDRFLHGNNNEKTDALLALGQARVPYLIQRSLDMFVKGTVRTQDYSYLMRSLAINVDAFSSTWRYFRQNYAFFEKTLNAQNLGQIVSIIGEQFDSNILLQEFNDFVQGKSEIPEYYVQSTRETINNKIKWISRNANSICSYMHSKFPGQQSIHK